MKRRKREAVSDRQTVGERWATGDLYGELFTRFKRLPPDSFSSALAKLHQQDQLHPSTTTSEVPEAAEPKRFEQVPEIAHLRSEPDGEGFVRILEEAWESFGRTHPKTWTADQLLHFAQEQHKENPGSSLRTLEGARRIWEQFPGSPFHALEQERVVRFLNLLSEQEQWE